MTLYPNLDSLNTEQKREEMIPEKAVFYITNVQLDEVKNATLSICQELTDKILDLESRVKKLETRKLVVRKK